MNTRTFELKLDSLDDSTGEFTGYAAVHSTVDSDGDVIKRGAFKRTLDAWRKSRRPIPVLYQHNGDEIVGATLEAREDEHGLFVRGRLLIDGVAKAREAYALLKAGVLSGLSIGYRTVRESYDQSAKVRNLEEVKLYEYSLVTWPMHDDARILAVKEDDPDSSSLEARIARLEEMIAKLSTPPEAPPDEAPADGDAVDPPAEHSTAETDGTAPVAEIVPPPEEPAALLGDEPSRWLAEVRALITH